MPNTSDTIETIDEQHKDDQVEKLESFEARWKYAVFPAMIAFFILAAFGFYLIYGMLQRMEDLSQNVYDMTQVIQKTMPAMQENISGMSTDMTEMSQTMQTNFPSLDHNIKNMSQDMQLMSYSTATMARSTNNMSQNVWQLNRNVSKPLSLMNTMIPISKNQRIPQPVMYQH